MVDKNSQDNLRQIARMAAGDSADDNTRYHWEWALEKTFPASFGPHAALKSLKPHEIEKLADSLKEYERFFLSDDKDSITVSTMVMQRLMDPYLARDKQSSLLRQPLKPSVPGQEALTAPDSPQHSSIQGTANNDPTLLAALASKAMATFEAGTTGGQIFAPIRRDNNSGGTNAGLVIEHEEKAPVHARFLRREDQHKRNVFADNNGSTLFLDDKNPHYAYSHGSDQPPSVSDKDRPTLVQALAEVMALLRTNSDFCALPQDKQTEFLSRLTSIVHVNLHTLDVAKSTAIRQVDQWVKETMADMARQEEERVKKAKEAYERAMRDMPNPVQALMMRVEEDEKICETLLDALSGLHQRRKNRGVWSPDSIEEAATADKGNNTHHLADHLTQVKAEICVVEEFIDYLKETFQGMKHSTLSLAHQAGIKTAKTIDDIREALPDLPKTALTEYLGQKVAVCDKVDKQIKCEEVQLKRCCLEEKRCEQALKEHDLAPVTLKAVEKEIAKITKEERHPEEIRKWAIERAREKDQEAQVVDIEKENLAIENQDDLEREEDDLLVLCTEIAEQYDIAITATSKEFLAALEEKIRAGAPLLDDPIVAETYALLKDAYPSTSLTRSIEAEEALSEDLNFQEKDKEAFSEASQILQNYTQPGWTQRIKEERVSPQRGEPASPGPKRDEGQLGR